MKITTERITIEANASELRESNSVASSFANMLRRAFQPADTNFEEDQEEEEESEPDMRGQEYDTDY